MSYFLLRIRCDLLETLVLICVSPRAARDATRVPNTFCGVSWLSPNIIHSPSRLEGTTREQNIRIADVLLGTCLELLSMGEPATCPRCVIAGGIVQSPTI